MPVGRAIKSAKQYRFMQMMEHNPEKARGKGPSPEVAKKLLHETSPARRKAFAKEK